MNKKRSFFTFILFLIVVAAIFTLNDWIQKEVNDMDQDTAVKPAVKGPARTTQTHSVNKPASHEIVKRTRVLPGTDLIEHFFYRGDELIAKQKFSPEGLIDQTGTVPDGQITFYDAYTNTHGEETYRDGKRHGVANTYFEDGQLKSTAYYRDGRLVTNEEYYNNGNLRFEVDYSEARDYPGDKEVGIGKLYFRDGKIKYEWKMTITDPIGYKKSYNRDGRLRHADYFDAHGNLMEQ